MGQLLIRAAGAAVGFAVGGPTGAQIGWGLAGVFAGAPDKVTKVQGPTLDDLRVFGTEYGQCIPWGRGSFCTAGQVWWNTDKIAHEETTTTTQEGSKGDSGSQSQETTITTYTMDLLIGLCDHEIVGVRRIWDAGRLIYSATEDTSDDSLESSGDAVDWDRMTVYTGTGSQLPDPDYEAALGVGHAPAYRHRAYVFIKGLRLGQAPASLRNLTFEVVVDGTIGSDTILGDYSAMSVTAAGYESITFDSTNATMIALVFSWSIQRGTGDFTDSLGNVWPTADSFSDSDAAVTLFLLKNPTNTGPNHTITATTGNFNQIGIAVACFKGGTGALSQQTGANSVTTPVTSQQPGALTANGASQLMLTALSIRPSNSDVATGTIAVNSGFTIASKIGAVQFAAPLGTPKYGVAIAYLIGPAQSSINPTWSWSNSNTAAACVTLTLPPEFEVPPPITRVPPTVESVMTTAFEKALLVDGTHFDVSALSTITRPVYSLPVSQLGPARSTIDVLATSYFTEFRVSDKIYAIPRGGASVKTIPFEDLGAGLGKGNFNLQLPLETANDIEVSAITMVSYRNYDFDYQRATEPSDRQVTAIPGTVDDVTIPMGFPASEAKIVADAIALDKASSGLKTTIYLLSDHCDLEPGDVFTVLDADGNSYRMRGLTREDTFPMLKFDAAVESAIVVESEGVTDESYEEQIEISGVEDTLGYELDIPMLDDSNNDIGFYFVARGEDPERAWPGAALYGSDDDVNYTAMAAVSSASVMGRCITTMGAPLSNSSVIDEKNVMRVNVGAGVVINSSTRAAVLASKTVNACVFGSELGQFITATMIEDGVYDLSRWVRGRQGTEWAMATHVGFENFAMLEVGKVARPTMPNAQLGVSRYYKPVSIGRAIATVDSELFTNNGISKKPYAPVYLHVERDASDNATLSWEHRSRFSVRMYGDLGVNVPLGEVEERYEVEIYSTSAFSTLLRTISVTGAPSAEYSAADQTSDGLTPGNPLNVRVYQISDVVGRGYVLQGTV